jgi:methylmalonyl-CoA carboxyltransferase 12S subunit
MIAGGGLGDVHPDEVGPISMQAPNGVVDVVAADEAEAVAVTKRLLAYFQGATASGECGDQTCLRTMVPKRARRAYNVAPLIQTLAVQRCSTIRDRRRDRPGRHAPAHCRHARGCHGA